MILLTVGTQLPFDRLVRAVDAWAGRVGRGDVFAQIGPSQWQPRHIGWTHYLEPAECRRLTEEADLIIAHAGMGSIITALELGKQLLVMPRRADLKEHRNDHQVSTATYFGSRGWVTVVRDEVDLVAKLDRLEELTKAVRIKGGASPHLIEVLRSFVNEVPSAMLSGQGIPVSPPVEYATAAVASSRARQDSDGATALLMRGT